MKDYQFCFIMSALWIIAANGSNESIQILLSIVDLIFACAGTVRIFTEK